MKNVLQSRLRSFILLIGSSLVLLSCQKEDTEEFHNLNMSATASVSEKASPAAMQGDLSIAEIVVSYSSKENVEERQFTLLLAALEYAGLTAMFTGGDQYTVFAPTDDAFRQFLGNNSLQDFTPEQVAAVLSYHVTEGRRFSNSVVPKNAPRQIETLLGPSIYVTNSAAIDTNDEDWDTEANIMVDAGLFDIAATNGVIHVIDHVLIPAEQ